ncbi:hypothetical protein HH308_16380 [Gordonia sp. TBRC 11910]|uniref:Uncharacterized protein n=1 Tax=Gordonia asplenii TaxID=2725283 RepID=A0A848KW31_9ACTN|nr:hypothetical protein [Gordonia asplenii]NMO02790.1 hypothetical protein [Gordonia asplenii]
MTKATPVCTHAKCAKKDNAEQIALDVIAARTSLSFHRVCEDERVGKVPDYRSTCATVAVEVKKLTSAAMEWHIDKLNQQFQGRGFHPMRSLQETWMLLMDTTEARESWDILRQSTGKPRKPRFDTMLPALEAALVQVEAEGANDFWRNSAVSAAVGYPVCGTKIPAPSLGQRPFGPGVLLNDAYGGVRSTDLDIDVSGFLNDWLSSERSSNARESLRAETGWRIAALVADSSGPAKDMLATIRDSEGAPSAPLKLPVEIDEVILIAWPARVILTYGHRDGWHREPLLNLTMSGSRVSQ